MEGTGSCCRCWINPVTFGICSLKVDFVRGLDIRKGKEEKEGRMRESFWS